MPTSPSQVSDFETFSSVFKRELFNLAPCDFEDHALQLFRQQARHNPVYRQYLQYLDVKISEIVAISQIPFLPISFFKTHHVQTGTRPIEMCFQSSGTTGSSRSQHFVTDTQFYLQNCKTIFELFYNNLEQYKLFALLPSYQEREGSSLILMIDDFLNYTKKESGYFLNQNQALRQALLKSAEKDEKTILFGVTYALLEFAEQWVAEGLPALPNLLIFETGGMKGRGRERVRQEVHQLLQQAFGVPQIHSEYGMTELLSQGYSEKEGVFKFPPWARVLLRDPNDPFEQGLSQGGINVIDLANVESCAFIETQDLGKMRPDVAPDAFEVLGRFDNSDVRGCNLLVL
ncbi:hypothetical protein [Hugenholtzia roseola]|uniref:LuxE/PaaK family acyltransferase n=1 Tax=Hugenholtzia roseola TaxID=1002 RepID=UPI00041E1334|nr:hypothetical protein [Hugenholtzia roseola]